MIDLLLISFCISLLGIGYYLGWKDEKETIEKAMHNYLDKIKEKEEK